MRGTSTKTPERVALALRLRREGVFLRDIADRLGIAISTADAWINDTDGSRCKARKESYAGTCIDCGGRTNGYSGRARAATRCQPCAVQWQHDNVLWSRDAVIEAIKAWHAAHGQPPTATEWRCAGETWPSASTVQQVCGGWNDGISAAGLEPRPPGCYGRPGEDDAVKARAAELYASGLSMDGVAERLGVAATTVASAARAAGVPIRKPHEWIALPPAVHERIVALYREGRTMEEVAEEVGCCTFTVWKYVNAAGAARSTWETRRLLASREQVAA